MNAWKLWIVVVVSMTSVVVGCSDSSGPRTCPEGQVVCSDDECHACCINTDCDDGIDCTVDSCSSATFTCESETDDNLCPSGEACLPSEGGCVFVACGGDEDCDPGKHCCSDGVCKTCCTDIDCDDGVDCTVDSCSSATFTCESEADDNLCPSGEACVPSEGGCFFVACGGDEDCDPGEHCCSDGACKACCTDIDCDDGIDCTVDSCSSATFICESEADDNLCPTGTACEPSEGGCVFVVCDIDEECRPGEHCCSNRTCRLCCYDNHCAMDEICNEEYECESICLTETEDCSWDLQDCCEGLVCDQFTFSCMLACLADGDCHARTDVDFAEDLSCNDGICDFDHCSNDSPCTLGRVCFLGNCISAPTCGDVASCQVTPTSGLTRQGTTARFAAIAFTPNDTIAPGAIFEWSTSDSNVASVDAQGLVTGGVQAGTATITATVASCPTTCEVTVYNQDQATTGQTRVAVVGADDAMPIQGAVVTLHGSPAIEETTDLTGVATFGGIELGPTNPGSITVTHADHSYLTLDGVESNDILAALAPWRDPSQASGVQTTLDFSHISCEPGHTCEASVGYGGISLPADPYLLNLDLVAGEAIKTTIQFGGSEEEINLPANLVMSLNQTTFKQDCMATGEPGNRVFWALGKKLDLSEVINVLGPFISAHTPEDDGAPALAALLNIVNQGYTAIEPGVEISSTARLTDVDDINGNGRTDDLIPDYDLYASMPGGHVSLNVKRDNVMTFSVPPLPANVDDYYYFDGVLIVAGVQVPGLGLVPLGVNFGADASQIDEPPDGQVDDIVVHVSPVAGRLPEASIRSFVLALAVRMKSASQPGWEAVGGQVYFVDTFSGTFPLAAFMPPAAIVYDSAARRADVSGLPAGADLIQLVFSRPDAKSWRVLIPGSGGDAFGYDLPEPPAAGDRADSASVMVIKLANGVDYQDLVTFNDSNLGDLFGLVAEFVITTNEDTLPPSCGGCATSTGGAGGLELMGIALLLVAIRRRRTPGEPPCQAS
ncbi:MAG: Ig-like domain-containing protein [Deltaproteobacteria bacterium]|nr:Ig-like domain-containing protein [Deltaproteobacteria bacterium]